MTVDVAPQTAGLIPLWLVPVGFVAWVIIFWLTARPLRRRLHDLYLDVLALGGLALAELLFFWRPLLSDASVPRGGGDLNSYFFPLQGFSAHALQTGHFPLWNPSQFGGMPQFANYQAAMLYPPNLIAWLLHRPYSYGTLEVLVIAHFFIASFGTYFLARSIGMRRVPASTAALVFSGCGFLTAHLGHYSMLSVAVWLPLLLLTLRMTAMRDSWLWAVASAMVIFLAATGGHQQMLLYELTAGAVWWLFWVGTRHELWPWDAGGQEWSGIERRLREGTRSLAFAIARAGGAVLVGLGLAAPMILPSLQMASLSVRSGLSYDQATEFSVEPVALIQFLLPKAIGSNPTDYWGSFASGEVWGYVGIVTMVFAAIGLLLRPSGVRLLLGAFAGVALLFALGPFTPLHGWVFRFVPPYNLIRAPARGYVFVDLGLALLAGFGLQELGYHVWESERSRVMLRRSLRWIAIVLAALILFVIPLFYSLILGVNDPSNRPVIAVDGLNLAVLYLAATAVILWVVVRGAVKGSVVVILTTLLIVVDLYGATASFNPTSEDLTAGFRHPEAVSFLQQQMRQDGPFRIASTTLNWQPDFASVAGLQDAGGLFDPMQPARYKKVSDVLSGGSDPALYTLLNVEYVVTDDKASAPGPGFTRALTTDDGLVLWKNGNVLPRVRLSYDAQPASVDDALSAVVAPGFDPTKTLYLSGNLSTAEPGGSGSATVVDYQDDRVSIHVSTDRPAYLVLADTAYPGWIASVDGAGTPIATADGIYRAIAVPAGTHDVVFRFKPSIVARSVVVSVVSFVALIVMAIIGFWGWNRNRRRAIIID